MPCSVGTSWQTLPSSTSKKPRWTGKPGGTPSNWGKPSTSSRLANKLSTSRSWMITLFSPSIAEARREAGEYRRVFHTHRGLLCARGWHTPPWKNRVSAAAVPVTRCASSGRVGWDREGTQQMTMGLTVCCRRSATEQGLFLNEASHLISIKYLLSRVTGWIQMLEDLVLNIPYTALDWLALCKQHPWEMEIHLVNSFWGCEVSCFLTELKLILQWHEIHLKALHPITGKPSLGKGKTRSTG